MVKKQIKKILAVTLAVVLASSNMVLAASSYSDAIQVEGEKGGRTTEELKDYSQKKLEAGKKYQNKLKRKQKHKMINNSKSNKATDSNATASNATASNADFYSSNSTAMIENGYLEFMVNSDGRFTIGNQEGNPSYDSDDNQILLFGHPNPWSSYTTIRIIKDNENYKDYAFSADFVEYNKDSNTVESYMTVDGITITQTLDFFTNPSSEIEDTVKISYRVDNYTEDNTKVGIRIMLDTMLADNDGAPFKILGTGNVDYEKEYLGNAVPQVYQVYDNLTAPTTFANGTLWLEDDRKPDKVQFASWGSFSDNVYEHTISPGSKIHDTAVGIFYNPVAVTSDKPLEVSTYYGTGVNLFQDSVETVSSTEFGVRIYDADTYVPLRDAEVSIEGIGTVLTNTAGMAIFDVNEAKVMKDVTVIKEGYDSITVNGRIARGTILSIAIIGLDSNKPFITKVEFGDMNLLNNILFFEEDVNKDEPGSEYECLKLKVTGKNIKVYRLIQDNKIKMESNDGIFDLEIKTKENNKVIGGRGRIKNFDAGKKVILSAVSETGDITVKELGIKISKPYDFSVKQDGKLTIGSKVSVDIPDDIPFLGGTSLDFGLNILPFDIEIEESGKIKICINKNKDDTFEETKDKFNNAMARAELTRRFNGAGWTTGFSPDVDVKVMGYGEGYLDNDTSELVINVSVIISGEGSLSYTQQFLISIVPVYIKIKGELSPSAQLQADAAINNSGNLQLDVKVGDLKMEGSLALSGGVGVSGALSVGAEGKATLGYLNNIRNDYQRIDLTGKATLYAEAFIFKATKKIAEHTWVLYDSYRPYNMVDQTFKYTNPELYQVMDRNYLTSRPVPASYRNILDVSGQKIIKDSVYDGASPRLIEANGKYYYFWLDDDGSKDIMNRTTLVYSVSEDLNTWSEDVAVSENKQTGDWAYDVAVDGETIYILWQSTETPLSNEATLETLMSESRIHYATIYANTGVVSNRQTISDKGAMLPSISADQGKVLAAWYSNSNNDVLSMTGTNYIYTRFLDGVWGEAKETVVSEKPVTTLNAGILNEQPLVAYTIDEDGDIMTLGDREVYITDTTAMNNFNTANDFADSNPRFFNLENRQIIAWYQDGNIAYMDSIDGDISYMYEAEVPSLNDNFIILSNGSLVWSGSDEENTGTVSEIYVSTYDEGGARPPYVLGKVEGSSVGNLSGLTIGDQYILGYSRKIGDISNDSQCITQICILEKEPQAELAFAAIDYESNAVYPGGELPVAITAINTGGQNIDQIDVTIGDYEETVLVEEIGIGELSTFTINYPVPEDISDIKDVEVTIKPSNGEIGENGRQIIVLGDTDLNIEASEIYLMDNKKYVDLEVSNLSGIEAEDVIVRLVSDEISGTVVVEKSLGTLEAKENRVIQCELNENIDSVSVLYGLITTSTYELITGNNNYLICLEVQHPILETVDPENPADPENPVVKYEVDFKAGIGGKIKYPTAKGSYQEGSRIKIKAVPDNGYLFVGWTSSYGGIFENSSMAETEFIVPSNNTILTANFRKKEDSSGGSGSGGSGSGGSGSGGSGSRKVVQTSLSIIPETPGTWHQDDKGWRYLKEDGSVYTNTWIYTKNHWYWLGFDGYMATGWILLQDKWYYLDAISGEMHTGWIANLGKWYYLEVNGAMKTGWILWDNKWYYLNNDGSMLVNSVTPDGYQVDEEGVWKQ